MIFHRRLYCLCIFFVLILVSACSFYTPVNAHGPGNSSVCQITNEYDFLSELSGLEDSVLIQNGYSQNETALIHNVNNAYREHLQQLATLNDTQLLNLGYSSEQISLFRIFDGSESQIRSLAATLTFDLYIDFVLWSQSNNRTDARLCYDFNWNGVPLIKTNDIVAVSWNNWTINGKLSYITYVTINGTGSNLYLPATYVPNSGPTSFGAGYRFAMTQNDNYYWAKSGYGIFTLYHNYTRADLSAYAKYGHSTILLVPSFSIPGYGAINFSYGVETKGQDWADMECQN